MYFCKTKLDSRLCGNDTKKNFDQNKNPALAGLCLPYILSFYFIIPELNFAKRKNKAVNKIIMITGAMSET